MLGHRLRRLGTFGVPLTALTFMVSGTAKAAYPYDPFTFDNSGQQTFIGGAYTYNSYSITTPNFRIDYANNATVGTAVSWTSPPDHTANLGGVIKMSEVVKTAGTATNTAFVMDLAPDANGGTGLAATGYSFWVQVLPGSAVSTGGASFAAGASGYFQSYYKTQPGYSGVYSADFVLDGVDQGNGAGMNFGDPHYTGTTDAGTWHYVQVYLGGTVPNFAAIGFQNYMDNSVSSRNYNAGDKVSWAIDDLTVYVPEPASLGLLGLGVPALLLRRRAKIS